MDDYITRVMSTDGTIRAYAAITTNMVNEAQRIHKMYPIAVAALGRTLTASAMMGAMLKGENDLLTIRIKGDGPLGGVLAVADSKCNVKGYVNDPQVDLPLKPNGKLDVGGAIGRNGYVNVVRDLGLKEPYSGQVPLATGEIAEDLTLYYARSEQIPTAIALGVLVDVDLTVKASGGYIVQLMPEADEKVAEKLESIISDLPAVTNMVAEGMTAEDILKKVLDGFELNIFEKLSTRYQCDCSRKRIEKALISLGEKELKDIIEEQGEAELTCHFCDKKYQFNKLELQTLLDVSKS